MLEISFVNTGSLAMFLLPDHGIEIGFIETKTPMNNRISELLGLVIYFLIE